MFSKTTVTIKDVAKAANVSTQTVSRVINNRPDVSAETRALVKEVIKKLNYAPNYLARGLSSGKTDTLGVVGFGLEYFGPSNVLTGISREANKRGLSLLLSIIDQLTEENVVQVLTKFVAQQVLGIIWAVPGFMASNKIIEDVCNDMPIPIVLMNRDQQETNIVISVNNRGGARLAVEHLLQQGYQKIGIITGPLDWWEAQERLNGWREVLSEKGIEKFDGMIFEGDWGVDSGDCGFVELYKNNPDLDAIFVSNDQMSLGVIQAANRLGLRIPDDLGIVGFDNIPESKFFFPPLSTINQPTHFLGAAAVKRLEECILQGNIEECIHNQENIIQPELIIRKSSLRIG